MNKTEFDPRIITFCNRLDNLGTGERARLRHCAGQMLAEARHGTLGLFYKLLPPDVPYFQHDTYFLVASLYFLVAPGGSGNFGTSLRQAMSPKNAKGLDRRVEILLDADEMQLPYRLRQAIHFLQANRTRGTLVNWPQLLEDLLNWAHPTRFVQRKWAKSYFAKEI